MQSTFRRTFLTGLVVILPLLVSYWVIRFVIGGIDESVSPFVLRLIEMSGSEAWVARAWLDYVAPLVSVVLAVLVIYLVGLLAQNVIGRFLLKQLDRVLMQIPIVRGIYSATRQFLDTFSSGGKGAFRDVVMVEYPRKGLWTLALVTGEGRGEIEQKSAADVVSVFVPTTPNPTSGWLLYVPKADVKFLSMSVDEAFKLIISGGVLMPESASSTD